MNGLSMALNLGFGASAAAETPVQPPENVQVSFNDDGSGGYNVDFTWDPPSIGPVPDSYNFSFSGPVSYSTNTVSPSASVSSVPASSGFSYEIVSIKGAEYSVPFSSGGITP